MTTLCSYDDIAEGAARGFSVGDLSLFAVKKDGEV